MTSKGYGRRVNAAHKRFISDLREMLKCGVCGSRTGIQFAHLEPTGLNGMGRGGQRRYIDIKRNPTKYIPLCGGPNGRNGCHSMFDKGQIVISRLNGLADAPLVWYEVGSLVPVRVLEVLA